MGRPAEGVARWYAPPSGKVRIPPPPHYFALAEPLPAAHYSRACPRQGYATDVAF